MPVHELFGGALRERIPLYWSRCGVIRSRCAAFFDGKVIDRPAVRSLADLEAAGREAFERGFAALKTNALVFDERGGGQYTPGSARGDGHPELNLPEADRRGPDRAARPRCARAPGRACGSSSISISTTSRRACGGSPRSSSRSS